MDNSTIDKSIRPYVADWLRRGMRRKKLSQVRLSELSDVSRETLWRLLHEKVEASEYTVQKLERVPEWPLRDALRDAGVAVGDVEGEGEGQGSPVGSGGPANIWDEPTEAEEQLRAFLRNIERTTRGMVGNPDLFEPADTRQIQLATCRAIMKSAEAVGRPLPAWFQDVYNELVSGTFT